MSNGDIIIRMKIYKGESDLKKIAYEYEEDPKKSDHRLIPIILMMGLVPLLVHMYEYSTNLSQFDWFPDNSETSTDFFFAWKMYAIIIVGAFIGLNLLYRHFIAEDKFRYEKPFALLGVYIVLVILSAICSKYKYWVAHGIYELFEPVWVVAAYVLLCYYTYNYVREEKQVDYILRWSGIGMAVVTLIGAFQYLGLDFFESSLGQHLITNRSYWEKEGAISVGVADKTSYTTLYNPNFLSLYFGMLIPLCLCLFIGAKKIWQKLLCAVAEILCLMCLIGSRSDSGWMALALGGAILVLVLLSRKKKTMVLGGVLCVVGIAATLVVGSKTAIGERIQNTVFGTFHMSDKFALQDVETGTDHVMLDIKGNELYLTCDITESGDVLFSCKDADGKEVEYTSSDATDETGQVFEITEERFKGIQVETFYIGEEEKFPCMTATIEDKDWMFTNVGGDEGYFYINSSGKPVKYEKVESAQLFYENAMSYRGHIWNMTIPLLKNCIFIGTGANTFMLAYPQDDYIGQEYIYSNGYQVKAHNWYLQQCVESGLIATLALIAFLGWYVIHSIRIYRRVDLHNRLSWVGFGFFAAVLVYLLAAFVNDSNVCTAPVFWGMLGLGLAVNRMLVEKEKLFVNTKEEKKKEA